MIGGADALCLEGANEEETRRVSDSVPCTAQSQGLQCDVLTGNGFATTCEVAVATSR